MQICQAISLTFCSYGYLLSTLVDIRGHKWTNMFIFLFYFFSNLQPKWTTADTGLIGVDSLVNKPIVLPQTILFKTGMSSRRVGCSPLFSVFILRHPSPSVPLNLIASVPCLVVVARPAPKPVRF